MTSSWHWHGGGLAAARARFGEGGQPWIDLSTGINPHAWPGVDRIAIDWCRLPEEPDLRALEEAAASYFGVDPVHVCAVPGTEIGLRMVGRLLGEGAYHLTPGYRTHAEIIAGGRPLSIDRLHEADGRTLILANPNNPDGRIFERSTLVDLLDRRGASGWLLIDEAFADGMPDRSVADQVGDARKLIVFRSFGKFFGLAGLRLGFVIAPRSMIGRLRQEIGAWPVSAAAIAIGKAAYRDRNWIVAMRERLAREALALDAMLGRTGFDPIGACPLFRLIEADDAAGLFARLAGSAILTRPFEDRPRWLRIGLPGTAEAMTRLGAALRDG